MSASKISSPQHTKKISAFLKSLQKTSSPVPSPSPTFFDNRTNLYLFFIYKATLHLKNDGELIFITPRDFTKATSAKNLNEYLHKTGTITHFQDYGDTKLFHNATPNCAVWRFQKGKTSPRMADGRTFLCHEGQLTFSPQKIHLDTQTGRRLRSESGRRQRSRPHLRIATRKPRLRLLANANHRRS